MLIGMGLWSCACEFISVRIAGQDEARPKERVRRARALPALDKCSYLRRVQRVGLPDALLQFFVKSAHLNHTFLRRHLEKRCDDGARARVLKRTTEAVDALAD